MEALADEIERLNGSVAEASANFEAHRPEDLEEAKKQIAALQKLITTISRYESELAKMRKDSEARDRQQREVRVRAAKARAEFDRIKVIYDEEYKQASVKLEALKKTRPSSGIPRRRSRGFTTTAAAAATCSSRRRT